MFSQIKRIVLPQISGLRGIATQKVGLLGVPFHKGAKRSGVHLGPKAIRDGGLIEEILEFNPNVEIKDYGDVNEVDVAVASLPENMCNYSTVVGTMQKLSQEVCKVLSDGRTCLTLGGDHSIAIGKQINGLILEEIILYKSRANIRTKGCYL